MENFKVHSHIKQLIAQVEIRSTKFSQVYRVCALVSTLNNCILLCDLMLAIWMGIKWLDCSVRSHNCVRGEVIWKRSKCHVCATLIAECSFFPLHNVDSKAYDWYSIIPYNQHNEGAFACYMYSTPPWGRPWASASPHARKCTQTVKFQSTPVLMWPHAHFLHRKVRSILCLEVPSTTLMLPRLCHCRTLWSSFRWHAKRRCCCAAVLMELLLCSQYVFFRSLLRTLF